MTTYLKHSGAWKELETAYVKRNGVWQNADEIFVNDNGVWKSVWTDIIVMTWRIRVTQDNKQNLVFENDTSRTGEAFSYSAGQTPWPRARMNIPTVPSGRRWEFTCNAGTPGQLGDPFAGFVGFRYVQTSNGATVGNTYIYNNWPPNTTLLLWNDTRNNRLEQWTSGNKHVGSDGTGNPIWRYQNSNSQTASWDNVPANGDRLTLTVTIF